jgi:hypothetical protein
MTITYTAASSAASFVNSIGVNTHIDFTSSSYANLSLVETAINYLGVKNLRDSPESTADLGATGLWQRVANATGAKFDAYIAEGSVAGMQTDLNDITTLAGQAIVNYIEGGNEEDDPYAVSLGNSLAATAQFQKQVYAVGHQLGLKVINMSFGQGWASSSTGDYGKVGSLAASADYANAHVYPGTGNTPGGTLAILDSDANLAAANEPVINTELGWYTNGSTTDPSSVSLLVQAKYTLDGLLDAYKAGDPQTYLYELLDEQSSSANSESNFGLFYANGTAKPAATAVHDLTTLLADKGGSFTPGTLGYSLTGTLSTDNSLLLEKSDGSFWLAIWNETRLSGPTSPSNIIVANHAVTLTLANAANIDVYDPLTGTSVIQSASGTTTIALSVPDHPILIEIQPLATGTSAPAATTTATTNAPATSAATTSSAAPTAQDLAITLPATATANVGVNTALAGVSIVDPWAANHAGSMALNLSVQHGTLSISNGTALKSGASLTLTGTLAQLEADLTSLSYVAAATAGSDTLSVNVWNQGGVSVTKTMAINDVGAATAQDLTILLPSSVTVAPSSTTAISGITISDPWGAAHAGSMALNLSVGQGTLEISNGATQLSGQNLNLIGSYTQLEADLATLRYASPAGIESVALSVNVWNQAGVSVTHSLGLIL